MDWGADADAFFEAAVFVGYSGTQQLVVGRRWVWRRWWGKVGMGEDEQEEEGVEVKIGMVVLAMKMMGKECCVHCCC